MSTCLTEVLFGNRDRDHGGILFNHRISIYENNVTKLVFEKRANRDGEPGTIEGIWIPHPAYLLESCILMAAVYGQEENELKKQMSVFIPNIEGGFDIDLCDMEQEKMFELFEMAKLRFTSRDYANKNVHSGRWKFIFALFLGSSMCVELKKLSTYDMDIEVLQSAYSSEYSEWGRTIEQKGVL